MMSRFELERRYAEAEVNNDIPSMMTYGGELDRLNASTRQVCLAFSRAERPGGAA
jgi:hypothetical protein